MNNYAKNDTKIRLLLKTDTFKVGPDGRLYSRICKSGHVTDTWRELILKPVKGYYHIYRYGSRLLVHRIVYQALKGRLNRKKQINHIDGSGLNNHPDNLELVTPRDNVIHMYGMKSRRKSASL